MMQGVNADNMDKMLRDLEEKLNAYYYGPSNPFLSISVVPAHPRSWNSPNYVSIGPHHCENSKLRREAEKASFLRQLLDMARMVSSTRDSSQSREPSIKHCLAHLANEVKKLLDQNSIEKCYGLSWNELKNSALVEMMLLDGCYLIAKYGQVGNDEQPQGQRSPVTGHGGAENNQQNHDVPGPSGGSSTEHATSPRMTTTRSLVLSGSAGRHEAGSPPGEESSPSTLAVRELEMGFQAPGQDPAPPTRVQSPSSSSITELERNGQSMSGSSSVSPTTLESIKQLEPTLSAEPRQTGVQEARPSTHGGHHRQPGCQQQEHNGHNANGSSSGSQQSPQRLPRSDTDTFWPDVVRDTWYLLENQMPFIVVEKIYEVTRCANKDVRGMFTSFARKLMERMSYISSNSSQQNPDGANANGESSQDPYHLLHILHTLLKPKPKPDTNDDSEMGRWRRASEYLRYSNVRFVKRNLDGVKAVSILDVDMEGSEVQIPRLFIDGSTWTILHNLIELERQHPWLGTYVTDYCLFMSQLASTAEDVELLLEDDIIEHPLGDPKNVAAGFQDLCREVVYDSRRNYLKNIWKELNQRYWSRRCNFLSWFRMKYWSFKNLPVVIALIVATVVFISEVISATYQVRSYDQQLHESHHSEYGVWRY